MKNLEIAKIFYLMAEFIQMDKASFISIAYNKAGRILESLEKDIEEIYNKGGLDELKKIPGIGKGIAGKIEEYIKTGKIKRYQELKKKCPVDLEKLTSVEGLGAKRIKFLYKKLKIKNLKDLEKTAKAGKIGKLDGFGDKSEKNILQSIEIAKLDKGRFLLGKILPIARNIVNELKELPETENISIAGSARRMKETIGDIDILVISSKPSKIMDFFVQMSGIDKVWAKGMTKSSVRLRRGFDADLRIVKEQSFGAALQYFTGSKDHNIALRKIAQKKGLKLNEYGVYRNNKQIAGKNEKQVYQAIGLSYIEPELRTNSGEIEAALQQAQGKPNQLPKLIGYNDIKGECHCHSDWSDGSETIEGLARIAKKMNYQYLVITDHASPLGIVHGLDEKRILKQMAEIDRVNKKIRGIKILKGIEVDIKADGSLFIKDEILSKLDLVLGAIHSGFKMDKEKMTKRLIKAIENPHVDVIAHPTGRIIDKRPGYQIDFDKILEKAKKNKTALEINAHMSRLDLRDVDIRRAKQAGVKMVIGTDVHNISYFSMMELGVAQARRGWAEKKDILNTSSLKNFLKYFK
ncbi:MAG: DNA polymerase/3'-5' exonuclease PolX [Parcubacteria group bacterium]|nr:DNA polymerase/3'-5' exonuclease PolX [Parcubacteria group bacterium]